jgi:type I restriction enzyme S subunit
MPEFQSIAESKATTMGHIKREHLKQAICAIPSQELIKRSAEVITPLIERSILSQQESKVLSELRDTLLPKLISGELRIPDAEKFLEEAGI